VITVGCLVEWCKQMSFYEDLEPLYEEKYLKMVMVGYDVKFGHVGETKVK